ncbi:hypothetical protein B566_EDAN017219, partial [Ephemera danica]
MSAEMEVDAGYLVHPSVSHGSLEQDFENQERIPRPVLFMKLIELAFACGCLATYSSAVNKEENMAKVGLCWATFGSQVIVMAFGLMGHAIGETTPRLTTWWDYEDATMGEIDMNAQSVWDGNMLLLTGIFAFMDAALLYADTLVAAVLWRLSAVSTFR